MSTVNEQIARQIAEVVWGECDLALVDELFAAEFIDRNPMPGLPPGREGLKLQIQALHASFSEAKGTVVNVIESGNHVSIHYIMSGVHTAEYMGQPATGNAVEVHGISHFTFEDGKVVEEYSLFDVMSMMMQIGAMPAFG